MDWDEGAWRGRVIDQVVPNLTYGDAVSDACLALKALLQAQGCDTRIFAYGIEGRLRREGERCTLRRLRQRRAAATIFHYATWSPVSQIVQALPSKLLLVYHNITPPEYFYGWNDVLAEAVRRGRADLPSYAPQTSWAWAFSEFSRRELEAAGFARTARLPFPLNFDRYRAPPDEGILRRYADDWVNILFVGRLTPNKRHDDILKVFYYYKKTINPRSRLFIVGSAEAMESYRRWLEGLVRRWGLEEVHFCGRVSFAALLAYYRRASVFLCLSEHEGFGVPLVEAMYFGVPVVAYAAAAVPETLGDAGVLVHRKEHRLIAELVHQLAVDPDLRAQVVAQEQERWRAFHWKAVAARWQEHLRAALEGADG